MQLAVLATADRRSLPAPVECDTKHDLFSFWAKIPARHRRRSFRNLRTARTYQFHSYRSWSGRRQENPMFFFMPQPIRDSRARRAERYPMIARPAFARRFPVFTRWSMIEDDSHSGDPVCYGERSSRCDRFVFCSLTTHTIIRSGLRLCWISSRISRSSPKPATAGSRRACLQTPSGCRRARYRHAATERDRGHPADRVQGAADPGRDPQHALG